MTMCSVVRIPFVSIALWKIDLLLILLLLLLLFFITTTATAAAAILSVTEKNCILLVSPPGSWCFMVRVGTDWPALSIQ